MTDPSVGELRGLREEDATAVASLFRAAFGDQRPIDAEEIVSWLRNPELNNEWLRVLEMDGRVVGYGDIWIDNDEISVEVAAPGHWQTFFNWAEERARADYLSHVRAFLPAGHELADAVAKRGYQLARSSYTMQIDFNEATPGAPLLSDGIALTEYAPGNAEALRSALNVAFENEPFFHEATPSHFREFYLGARWFDPSLWLLAWDRTELAGFVLTFPERPGDPDLGWVQTLGVRPEWRRRGIGEALLLAAFQRLHNHGLRRVGLGVDALNETGALRLYEHAGMRVVQQGDNWVLTL